MASAMPWDESENYIRSGHRDTEEFEKNSIRTITISEAQGIKALVGCPKGACKSDRCGVGMQVMSYLFAKDHGWTREKAVVWFEGKGRKGGKGW